MPGQAVRVGDQTAHGGTVTGPGSAVVLVGGKPAARMGDMQVCPMMNGTVPHGSSAILQGVTSVMIDGKPAATSGDMTGLPCGASLAVGETTVLIGTDPPVNAAQQANQNETFEFHAVVKNSEGDVLANTDFHFSTPNGTIIQGRTTNQGEIHIYNLDNGICKIQIGNSEIDIK